MAKYAATGRSQEQGDLRRMAEEKKLEEELLTQEQLESLAWPIWNDVETRISRAVQAHNARSGSRSKLYLTRQPDRREMLVRTDEGQSLSIKLNAQTGVISFGDPASASEECLVIRIEDESSYRIEREHSGEVINPGALDRIILDKLLNPRSGAVD